MLLDCLGEKRGCLTVIGSVLLLGVKAYSAVDCTGSSTIESRE